MSQSRATSESPRFVDGRWALIGGLVTAVALFLAVSAVGRLSSVEGRRLLELSIPNLRFLTSAIIGAGATILALMLTLLGIAYATEWEFREIHYQRVKQVAIFTTISIVGAVVLLLFIGLPLEEAENLTSYYNLMYGLVTGAASLLGGMMVAVVLMLYQTIRGVIAIGQPSDESELIEETAETT
ncbi:MAG: hypothetical protein ACRDZM_17395 [Acidimicrobiia bacterium]